MGRMLEALKQIEAKGDSPPVIAASEPAPVAPVVVADERPLPVSPVAVDSLFEQVERSAAELFAPAAPPETAAEQPTTRTTATMRSTPGIEALASQLHRAHGGTGVLMLAGIDAEEDVPSLLDRLAVAMARTADAAPTIVDSHRTELARLAEWRAHGVLALISGRVTDDEAMELGRHCDGVYLVVALGKSASTATSAAARIRTCGGRLLGGVALG